MPAPLHPLARRPVAEFLRLADARLPGVVQGLYLVGSIALDDFHTGVSDVDFLAVTAEPLDDAALDRLERSHRRARAGATRAGDLDDRPALAAWTIENLNSYWTGLAKRAQTSTDATQRLRSLRRSGLMRVHVAAA